MSAPASRVGITVSVLMATTATPVSVRPDSREPTVKSVSGSFCVVPPVKLACVLLGLELNLRLAPSKSAYLCVFHSFMEWVVGIFNGTEVCFDLLHFLSGLHWWEV